MKKLFLSLSFLASIVSTNVFANTDTVICEIENEKLDSMTHCILGEVTLKNGSARIRTCELGYKNSIIIAGIDNSGSKIVFSYDSSMKQRQDGEFKVKSNENFILGTHTIEIGDGLRFACGKYYGNQVFKLVSGEKK